MDVRNFFKNNTLPITNERSVNRSVSFHGFHLSYNPSSADYGCSTTAMVLDGRVFFVLDGDHQQNWLDAAMKNDAQGCIDYFIEHIDQANSFSEHLMAIKEREDIFFLHETALALLGQHNLDRISQAVESTSSLSIKNKK